MKDRTMLSLTVGGSNSITTSLLSPLYRRLSARSGELNLRIVVEESGEIYRRLQYRNVDVGFVAYERALPGFVSEYIVEEPMVLVSRTNRLATLKDGKVTVSSLDPRRQVYIWWGPVYEAWHRYWLGDVPGCVSVDRANMAGYFLDIVGAWAVVPMSTARMMRKENATHIHPLDHPPPPRTCFMVHSRKLSGDQTRALQTVRECLAQAKTEILANTANVKTARGRTKKKKMS